MTRDQTKHDAEGRSTWIAVVGRTFRASKSRRVLTLKVGVLGGRKPLVTEGDVGWGRALKEATTWIVSEKDWRIAAR